MHYVYNLRCNDESIYTGCTKDLEERLKRHKKGYVPATKDGKPIAIICYTAFKDKQKAFQFESYLKSGSGRAFIRRHFM
jgi:predicted GIY-YIG superfamily endonuclease